MKGKSKRPLIRLPGDRKTGTDKNACEFGQYKNAREFGQHKNAREFDSHLQRTKHQPALE